MIEHNRLEHEQKKVVETVKKPFELLSKKKSKRIAHD